MHATINGRPWDLTRAPAWSQSNAYLLWTLYRELSRVHAIAPLARVTVTRASATVFDVAVEHRTAGEGWTMRVTLSGGEPSIEKTGRGPWSHVVASRALREVIVDLLWLNPGLIDDLVVTL